MYSQKGSILITVLLFLVVATLAVSTALSTSLLELKMNNHFKDKGIALQAAEAGLAQASLRLKSSATGCISHERNDDFYFMQTKSWWLTSGQVCHGNDKEAKISYVIEILSLYPCLRVIDPKNKTKKMTVELFRVTSFAMTKNQHAKILLQATYAVASRKKMICEGQEIMIKTGRQSWADLD